MSIQAKIDTIIKSVGSINIQDFVEISNFDKDSGFYNKPNIEANATAFAIRNKCECIRSFLLQKQRMFVSQITEHTFLNASDCMAFSWRANRTGAGYTTMSGTSSGFKFFYDKN